MLVLEKTMKRYVTAATLSNDQRDNIADILDRIVVSVVGKIPHSSISFKAGSIRQESDNIVVSLGVVLLETPNHAEFSKLVGSCYNSAGRIQRGFEAAMDQYSLDLGIRYNPTLQIEGRAQGGSVMLSAMLQLEFLLKLMEE
jgi:hypothetical protein